MITDTLEAHVRTTTWTYNTFGQMLTEDGPREDVSDVMTYTYHECTGSAECGQLYSVTNPLGHTTIFTEYDSHGYPKTITDSNNVQTRLTYDNRQRIVKYEVDGVNTALEYDPTGNLIRLVLGDGTYTQYTWDDANRLTAINDAQGNRVKWTLDAAGNRTNELIKDVGGQVKKRLDTHFDALSRVRSMVFAHSGSVSYTYDKNSNLISRTDAGSRVNTSNYDALDRLIKTIDPLLGETDYTYDERDNLISVTDPEGLTTLYAYNGFDDRISEQSPDTGLTTYTYDSASNVLTQTDARNIQVNYSYDALNRVTSITYPVASENINYSYDQGANGVGRLTQISDASGTTDIGYDSRGNTTSMIYTIGGQSYTQTYTYNSADRLTDMTYPSGRSVSYSYDANGRINQVSSVGAEGTETLASNVSRLPFGPITALTLGNGLQRQRSYDQDYRVLTMADGTAFEKGYAYNIVNNITAITDVLNTGNSQLFAYDDLDRLEFAAGSYGDDDYTYDGIGNRLSATRDTQSETYQYSSSSHRLQSRGSISYTYDAVGNTLSSNGSTFTYSDRNRLESVTQGAASTNYIHNAFGQRVIKAGASGDTHFVYDLEGRVIAEANASTGAVTVEYAYFDGEPLVMWREQLQSPVTPTPLAPQGTTNSATPTYSWEPEAGSTRYQIRVYDQSVGGFVKNAQYAPGAVCAATSCDAQPQGYSLVESPDHYWQVRAQNSVGWGDWSDQIDFDYVAANQPPGAPMPLAPLATTNSATPTFSWEPVAGSTRYRIRIYDQTVGSIVRNVQYAPGAICTANSCDAQPQGYSLTVSPDHYWQVRAQNSVGWGDWGDQIDFEYVETTP